MSASCCFPHILLFTVVSRDNGLCQRRANTVAAHAHLGCFRDGAAVCCAVVDVAVREALGAVKLVWREHAQADIDNLVIDAVNSHKAKAVLGRDGVQRFVQQLKPSAVREIYDERICRFHDVAHDALGDAPAGGISKGLAALEDRRARDRPVDDLCCRAPGRLALRWPLERSLRRPCDGHAVVSQRPPGLEFLDVLKNDHSRPHGLGPLHDDPGQAAYALGYRLAALGFAEVFAIRAGP